MAEGQGPDHASELPIVDVRAGSNRPMTWAPRDDVPPGSGDRTGKQHRLQAAPYPGRLARGRAVDTVMRHQAVAIRVGDGQVGEDVVAL